MYKARCTACSKEIDMSNMGESALTSHMKSKKQSDSVKRLNDNIDIADCFKTKKQVLQEATTSKQIMVASVSSVMSLGQK